MYHTEGFVNPYTLEAKEHIMMLTLKMEERPWYLWCVAKEAIAEAKSLKQVLSFWLQQTLLTKGCKNRAGAQRELNRLGSYLQKGKSFGEAIEDIELFMYYRGEFYRWNNDMYENDCEASISHLTNIYREVTKGVYAYVSEEGLWEQYTNCDTRPEVLANAWELSLLKDCSLGTIKQGFFLMWEDTDDV